MCIFQFKYSCTWTSSRYVFLINIAEDAHKTQTYCMMKHSHFPCTSTYSSTPHNTNRKHPSHPLHKHTTYVNTPRLKNRYFQQRTLHNKLSHRPPHSHYNRQKTNMRHVHTYMVSMHLATRGNNKLLRTPPPPPTHISSSEEILPPPHSSYPCPTQNKQISLPQIILTQSRRQITYITPLPTL